MFHIWKSVNLEDFKTQPYYSINREVFTFPETLGALFFGASLVVFYSTIKRIVGSRLSGSSKFFTFIGLEILIVLGILDHVFKIDDVRMSLSLWYDTYNKRDVLSVYAFDDPGFFVEKLHVFIVIFTGWAAALVLGFRAYILAGRILRFGYLLAFLLFSTFITQLVFYCVLTSYFPVHPILNLVIQVPVTLAVLFHSYKRAPDSKIGTGQTIEGVLIDSGALLTVGLIVQTIIQFIGVGFVTMSALLPHLQNITTCTVFVRLVSGESHEGVIRLPDEESAHEALAATAPTSPA